MTHDPSGLEQLSPFQLKDELIQQMLQFAGGSGKPARRLLLIHDDKAREFDYVAGAEKSLDLARTRGWTVVSMKNDWKNVFAN